MEQAYIKLLREKKKFNLILFVQKLVWGLTTGAMSVYLNSDSTNANDFNLLLAYHC